MPKPLTNLGKALEGNRIAAGLPKKTVATRMGTKSRGQWENVISAPRPTVDAVRRAATAVMLDQDVALELAGYDPQLVAETRQQPEQQQRAVQLAG